MATVANHITDIIAIVKYLEELETGFAAAATDGDSVVSGKAGDIDGELEALFADDGAVSFRRSNLASATETIARLGFGVKADQLARTLGRSDIPPGTDPVIVYGIGLRDWMLANTKVFESRAVTNSAPSAITGTGNGVIKMLSTDDQSSADELENVNAETLTFTCRFVAGQGSIQSGNEVFEVYGGQPYRDIHEEGGSGNQIPLQLTTVCATQSNIQIIGNADFDADHGTASSVDKIPSWTCDSAGTASAITQDSSKYYRAKRDGTAGSSLKFNTAGTYVVSQRINGQLPDYGPLYVSARWSRRSSATGTLAIAVGAGSMSATISTGTNDAWNLLETWLYPDDYTAGGNDVTITVTSLATGELNVDDLCIAVPTLIGGKFYVALAGSTDFIIGDYTTQQSTITGTGTVLKWFYRTYRPSWSYMVRNFPFNLPHATSASSGFADP